ncbi:MAG: hypothetical protein A3D31_13665 [Candidatus Fluviicola riflensis]|nr:MAG: hypothetical protein CHH17_18100 [Candidatus Fluviicola riflensis]OGS78025.1 MAG: hypothetical protein A3D31_13665 [Candidatus Fluviicola riflensis]OGS85090.1 MAG: hypothetical protein A2724_10600 [Fluviicola sp. RIFCSPHIGHO2_01_FULL_43_53]OGS89362.1 MAG: hypothetical protein A3E30_04905 [Fluviicola sp. RIFCSPHIGHO2_12_FULL_43_24]
MNGLFVSNHSNTSGIFLLRRSAIRLRRSEVRKMAVSLCFVKSACVSDPDLPLLTLKRRKSRFSRAALNGAKKDVLHTFRRGWKSMKESMYFQN